MVKITMLMQIMFLTTYGKLLNLVVFQASDSLSVIRVITSFDFLCQASTLCCLICTLVTGICEFYKHGAHLHQSLGAVVVR